MKNYYISTKLIQAEPNSKNGVDGFDITYLDGYKSWCPKDVFEKVNLKVQENKALPSGVSIGMDMVKNFVKDVKVDTIGEKTTIVTATLVNGFELTETSACVDPNNYNEEIGKEICMEKIYDKVWFLLGFLLQTAYNGIK